MGATVKQIAEIAKVSRGTVDRVIHGRYGVDPETRRRVLEVMEELQYKPNAMAKALRGMQNPIKIGAIVPSEKNPFYIDINDGIDKASEKAADYGVEVIKLKLEQMTVEEQLLCIEKLEQLNVSGIMLVPIEDERIRNRLNSLPDHIPVITFNSDISGTKRLCFVGNEHLMAGRTAGQLMNMLVTKPGKIALLISQPDFLAHTQRVDGFCRVFNEEKADIEMLGPYNTYESEDKAYEIVKKLVMEEELAGIYVAGGGQQAAARAVADTSCANKIHIICHDTLPETVQYVKSGVVDFTLGQEAFVQGYMPVEIFRDFLVFNKMPRLSKIFTRIDIRSKENISLKGYEVFTD